MSNLQCPENKVPGWLDENGQPQGCVDNNPMPGMGKVTEVPEQPTELAVTGSMDVVGFFLFGVLLFLIGGRMIRDGIKSRS